VNSLSEVNSDGWWYAYIPIFLIPVGGVARWLGCQALQVDFLCPVPDLWLTGDHFVSKLSCVSQPSLLVGIWVVIHTFTWITNSSLGLHAAYGCRLELWPRLFADSVCDAQHWWGS